ncbi:MAG: OmpA family protein [Planctomycetes bacterium]|nr:OmpA family protein [Planctomycetota bacterium]
MQHKMVTDTDEGEHWLSISDLMAGLLMVFLFISIALMHSVNKKADEDRKFAEMVKQIVDAHKKSKEDIYNQLVAEFDRDLATWDAAIERDTLTMICKSPEVLFEEGKSDLKPRFQQILNDFFPRYLDVLLNHRQSIQEVRIEGHTSTNWNRHIFGDTAYFKNMELSQGRTRSVLTHIFAMPETQQQRNWIMPHLSAVGYSSSHPILTAQGDEDDMRSRRVVFRVITNAEQKMSEIVVQFNTRQKP